MENSIITLAVEIEHARLEVLDMSPSLRRHREVVGFERESAQFSQSLDILLLHLLL